MSFIGRLKSTVTPILKGGAFALKWAAVKPRSSASAPAAGKLASEPVPPPTDLIAAIHRRIEEHSRQGYVSDADVITLRDAHRDGLTEDRNRFEELEHHYEAACRRLDALFPEVVPPMPEPEPEEPPKPRHFPRLSDLLGGGGNTSIH